MRFYIRLLYLTMFFSLGFASISWAQQNSNTNFYGDIRALYSGSSTNASGLGGKSPFLRIRAGIKHNINANNSIAARGVYIFSRDLNSPDFSLHGSGGLNADTFSFDELYYSYQDEANLLKLGRFQKSYSLPTATGNSIMRFQSSGVSSSWSDGVYYQRKLNNGWATDIILEYQQRGKLSFPYKFPLTFGKNKHNLMGYFGFINNTRDKYNIIEKNVSLMWAPDAFWHNGKYISYLTVNGSVAFDFPKKELLNGGSFRVTGELGQNVMTRFEDGTAGSASVGAYNVSDIHNIIAEFTFNDREYLNSPFPLASNNLEVRYGISVLPALKLEARYQISSYDITGAENTYSTFFRATYTF